MKKTQVLEKENLPFEEQLAEARREKAAKNKAIRRSRRRNTLSVVLLAVVAAFLVLCMSFYIRSLRQRADGYESRVAELESQVAQEESKTQELETQGKLRQTLKYIEQIAREKLGLVFPGDVILEPKEQKP